MPFDVTALLKDWGVTLTMLAVAATAFCVVLVISFREFAFWFLRTNQILKNQKEILHRLEEIQKAKAQPTGTALAPDGTISATEAVSRSEGVAAKSRFPVDAQSTSSEKKTEIFELLV